MEKLILYSTGCPQCNTLKRKLDAAEIEYDVITDQDKMIELGFRSAPILAVGNEKYLNFSEAIKWLKEFANGN